MQKNEIKQYEFCKKGDPPAERQQRGRGSQPEVPSWEPRGTQAGDREAVAGPKAEESHLEKTGTCPGGKLTSCAPGYRPGDSSEGLGCSLAWPWPCLQHHLPRDPTRDTPTW